MFITWTKILTTLALIPALAVVSDVTDADAASKHKITHAKKVALNQRGDPYVYGANGPGAFDCSGLFDYSFRKVHVPLPRTADAQMNRARRIPKSHVKPGDFVGFETGGHFYHIAMFLHRSSHGKVILSAPHTGASVRKDTLWTGNWHAATLRRRH